MQDQAAAGTLVLTVVAAAIAIIQVPATANAFFEPLASKLMAKKMLLKHSFVPMPPVPKPMYFVGHVVHQPTPPPPPPSPTYPPYGPQPSYPSYGPPSGYQVAYHPPGPSGYHVPYRPPSPPSHTGYEPAPAIKPYPPHGCLPGTTSTSPPPTVDYSHYPVQHGSINYGNNGNTGGYGKK